VTLSAGHALADRRVALVIGNAQYKNASLTLPNPRNDAEDVAAVLRKLGFEVVYATDATKRDFDLAMAKFARTATDADVALFYYAGHALQLQGRNYLMPTDAELEDEISVRYQMEPIEDIRAALDRAAGVKIMILDACRNNPVAERLRRKMTGESRNVDTVRGLARIDRAQGMVVAYATAADNVALDGTGRNSPYTRALLKRLQEPGLEIEMMFRRIAADVNTQTEGRQRPETYVSLLSEYYLNQTDRLLWDQMKDSNDPAAFRDFITRFPSSPLVSNAQMRLQDLERAAREVQAAREQAEREAARLLQEEDQRRKTAATEQERAAREAAQRRQDEEQRKKAAVQERERAEREAAQKRQDEEKRAKAEAEARLKVAALEQERTEREAAQRRQEEEQRRKAAALEQERAAREAALRREEDERRAKAEAEQKKAREAGLQVLPTAPPQDQASCKRDEERLARLRISQDPDEVIRFERELTCEKLRPQVIRLRESVAGGQDPGARDRGGRESTGEGQPKERQARADGADKTKDKPAGSVKATVPPEQACKRDEEKLARLRVSRVRDEVVKFEHDLACEKLRPQVVRLRESVAAE
jgi:chemotaxis protein histidine kinase CheA